ncbi:uncharacterized protein ARMOST_15265 [Armillaria ostoyae]|uniref:Uncharacterized protein n=1 Tax=Armillaria ostoyae TaxID=47428 RepID=A0A284RSX1_ARMOS|nr:uncharacterized protein ARMOST_15265 [Armillaria ostoyae]
MANFPNGPKMTTSTLSMICFNADISCSVDTIQADVARLGTLSISRTKTRMALPMHPFRCILVPEHVQALELALTIAQAAHLNLRGQEHQLSQQTQVPLTIGSSYDQSTPINPPFRYLSLNATIPSGIDYRWNVSPSLPIQQPSLLQDFLWTFVISDSRQKAIIAALMIILHDYPGLQIICPEDAPPRKEGGDPRISPTFIDGHSHSIDIPETGRRYCTSRLYHSVRSRLVPHVWWDFFA